MTFYDLTPEEIRELDVPPRGSGGFQTLIRRLQTQVNHAVGTVRLSEGDIEDIQRYAFDFEQGGFQDRLLAIFGRVLGPHLGRANP